MKRLTVITLIALLTFHISTAQPTKAQIKQVEDAKKEVKNMKGQTFPGYQLTDLSGKTYSSDDLRGKIVLMNFWFSRCGPCIQEMPELNELVEEFTDDGVVLLAPTFDDAAVVDRFLQKREFNYQLVPDVKDFCLELNVRSYPTHFVIDREGIIEKVLIGYSSMTVASLRKSIRKLLRSE